jgi:hypothetical protein
LLICLPPTTRNAANAQARLPNPAAVPAPPRDCPAARSCHAPCVTAVSRTLRARRSRRLTGRPPGRFLARHATRVTPSVKSVVTARHARRVSAGARPKTRDTRHRPGTRGGLTREMEWVAFNKNEPCSLLLVRGRRCACARSVCSGPAGRNLCDVAATHVSAVIRARAGRSCWPRTAPAAWPQAPLAGARKLGGGVATPAAHAGSVRWHDLPPARRAAVPCCMSACSPATQDARLSQGPAQRPGAQGWARRRKCQRHARVRRRRASR